MQRLSSGLDMETLRAARHCAGSGLALNDRQIVPPVVNRCGALPFVRAAKTRRCSQTVCPSATTTMRSRYPRADPVWPDLCSRRTRSSSAALSVLCACYSATTVLPRSSPGPIAWSPVSAPYPGTCWCSRATFRSPARHTSDAGGHYTHLADPAYLEVDGSRSSSTQTARGGRARPS